MATGSSWPIGAIQRHEFETLLQGGHSTTLTPEARMLQSQPGYFWGELGK